MKRKPQIIFGKKSMILAAVSLVLVVMTVVGVTVSWIEDVSQVEFSSTDHDQETPLRVGQKVLKADAEIKSNPNLESISLGDFFNESGDMHLSPCYGDGEKFYFPVEGQTEGGSENFRTGTKDDENVNYLSMSFRVKSEGAGTSYWFEKTGTTPYISFKKGTDVSQNTDLLPYLRCSVTVDGVTNVYVIDNPNTVDSENGNAPAYDKSYKTVINNAVSTQTGRSIEEYSYYNEVFNDGDGGDHTSNTAANAAFANQGAGNNLNGNTLFAVNQYDSTDKTTVKTVTVKIWLEYDGLNNNEVNVANLNLNIVSSWAKTRRVFIKDSTVDEIDNGSATGPYWLTHQNTPTLHWALKSNVDTHFDATHEAGSTVVFQGSNVYVMRYVDIPAVYNNVDVYMYRCDNGWNNGSRTLDGVTCWDQYKTTFPNTFHSETYTVYTKNFGTWESVARYVQIINSCHFENLPNDGDVQFEAPYAYMWDNSTDTPGQADRVVQNGSWPGSGMTKLHQEKSGFSIYSFYYNSIFDRIIFNDNYVPSSAAYQTADINLDQAKSNPQYYVGKIYDMATMKWYNNQNSLPTYSSYSVHGNFYTSVDEDRYTVTRMVVNPSNSDELYCRVYVRYKNTGNDVYKFKIFKHEGPKNQWVWYGGNPGTFPQSEWKTIYSGTQNYLEVKATEPDSSVSFRDEYKYYYYDDNNVLQTGYHPGVYGIYFKPSTNEVWVQRESING